MRTLHSLQKQLDFLKNKKDIDREVLSLFEEKLQKKDKMTRDEGATDHFCCFVVPINIASKKIFIGHHIKSDSWIPPGGHIDKNETPKETVKREFKEELRKDIPIANPIFFDLSLTYIKKMRPTCTLHYNLWYLIPCEVKNFDYDKKEFYTASWHSFKEASFKMPEHLHLHLKKIEEFTISS